MRWQFPEDIAFALVVVLVCSAKALLWLSGVMLGVALLGAGLLSALGESLFDTSILEEGHEQETTRPESGDLQKAV